MKSLLSLLLLLAVGSSAFDWTCNLFCYNEGECRHGKGKFGSWGNIDEETPWESKSHVEGMFCSCPIGYTGLQCEISLKLCGLYAGEDTYTCHNGNECMSEKSGEGKPYRHCECDVDTVFGEPYVEKYCEHIATVFCSHNKNDDTFASSQFCTNGGKCKEADVNGTKHPGCDCPEGWAGLHCTERVAVGLVEKGKEMALDASTTATILAVVAIVIIIFMIIIGCCFFLDRRRAKRRRMQAVQEIESGAGLIRPKRGKATKGMKGKKGPKGKKMRNAGGRASRPAPPPPGPAPIPEYDDVGLRPYSDQAHNDALPSPVDIL